MSRSNRWENLILVILAASVLLLMAAIAYAIVISEYAEVHKVEAAYQKNAETDRYGTQQEIANSCYGKIKPAFSECVAAKLEAYYSQQATNEDLKAQKDMAFWTLWMFIATVFAIAIASLAAVFAWQQVFEARRIGEAQTRAYLGAIKPFLHTDEEGHYYIRLYIKNFGNTPARRVFVTTENVIGGKMVRTDPHIYGQVDPGYEALAIVPVDGDDEELFKNNRFVLRVTIDYATVYDRAADGWKRQVGFYVPSRRVDGTEGGLHIYPDSSSEKRTRIG